MTASGHWRSIKTIPEVRLLRAESGQITNDLGMSASCQKQASLVGIDVVSGARQRVEQNLGEQPTLAGRTPNDEPAATIGTSERTERVTNVAS
jgi:hypothetical protein